MIQHLQLYVFALFLYLNVSCTISYNHLHHCFILNILKRKLQKVKTILTSKPKKIMNKYSYDVNTLYTVSVFSLHQYRVMA